ncbi:uncharacterized protein METZ01_LOCUS85322 [marine metagenome]|uniref:Uncharacterized protein n=1 Tax=marine metagenome TaxID=408172 RepID=A0A381UXY4_9ZZZZ
MDTGSIFITQGHYAVSNAHLNWTIKSHFTNQTNFLLWFKPHFSQPELKFITTLKTDNSPDLGWF